MEINKCVRCGCFYTADSVTCPACTPKDNKEISKLKNFFETADLPEKINVNELSSLTGISQKNISRYAGIKDLNFKKKITL